MDPNTDNASLINEEEFFRSVASSFFTWVTEVFLPILLLVLYIFFALVGAIVNITVLVVTWRTHLYKQCVHAFVIQMCVADLLACLFLLLPTIASLAKGDNALDFGAACALHEVMFTLCLLLTFGFLVVGVIERMTRTTMEDVHLKSFGNVCVVRIIIGAVWCIDALVALITLAGNGGIQYHEDQFQCDLDFPKNAPLMHIVFALTMYAPPVVYLICFVLIFFSRTKLILKMSIDDPCKNGTSCHMKNTSNDIAKTMIEGSTSVFYVDSPGHLSRSNSRVGDISTAASNEHETKLPTKKFDPKMKWRTSVQRLKRPSKVKRIFQDHPDDIDHHQSMTYLITWLTVSLCWLVYLIAALTEVYGHGCPACYRVGVLLGISTYCSKPIIYAAHNRWYRRHCWNHLKATGSCLFSCIKCKQ